MHRQLAITTAAALSLSAFSAGAEILQTSPGYEGVVGGGLDFLVVDTSNDTNDWIDDYGPAGASGTLYYSFNATQTVFGNGEDPGGAFGGLFLYNGGSARLLVGNNWNAHAWSGEANGGGFDLNSLTPEAGESWERMALNEEKHFVVRIDFNPNADDTATIYMTPQPGLPEFAQPPLLVTTVEGDFEFDGVYARAGNGPNEWDVTDVTFATEFGDLVVVPEPGSLALIALGAAAVLRRRRG